MEGKMYKDDEDKQRQTTLRTNTEYEKENRTTQKTGKEGWVMSGSL